ncbi:glycosyl transferase [Leifsonia virtsii]|uniref:Glycosyl transferase n=1 Tax=Leifsonia virtsii TaxID=3035915 RepID=A0ABT8IWA4_9MICO|nr:glycosyl transferase [Leifsonia virtsii]MDN4597101.1 glycosyl transferase [Leifsonia virtsii]
MPIGGGEVAELVVQQSFPDPRPTTNPYLIMLRDAIAAQSDVELRTFTWRRALLARYDVFHVHWPEILVSGHSPLKKLVRQALTLGLVLKLRITRTPIVRTAHNLDLPSGISRREVWLLRLIDRWTTLRIRLNPLTPVPDGSAVETIEHGHYRDWFAPYPRRTAIPGRLAYVGLVRRYKGVDALIAAFRDAFRAPEAPAATLTVSGRPSSDELAGQLQEEARGDDRIFLRFAFLTDEELVAAVTESELIVLPYREMHNSGGALSSLSLDRPVLVPDNDVNRLLAREVGETWVQRYDPPLRPEHLEQALAAVRGREPGDRPDLDARSWDETGRRHVAAYRRAIELRRGRRGRTRPA